jgi:hypothetical protein
MALFTFNQITMTLLVTCVIFSVTSIATTKWNSNGIFQLGDKGVELATKVFIVTGTVGACLALFIQILINVSTQFAVSRAVQLLCLVFVLIGFVGLLVGVLVYGIHNCSSASACGYSYWFSVIGSVLIFEATIFYVIAWRCP